MNYLVELPRGESLKLYFNEKVYSPEYSSSDTIVIADELINRAKIPNLTLLDVACGGGVLGLSLKKLHPEVLVDLSDVDREAVRVTKLNAKRLGLDVEVYERDLLKGAPRYDFIVANLPTFSEKDLSQELHGPLTAYFGGTDPLNLYKKLFSQAKDKCSVLVCECQTKYQDRFLALAEEAGYKLILRTDFGFAFLA